MSFEMGTVRSLLRKELRQVRRSRGAIVSATILSLVLLVAAPGTQLVALMSGARAPVPLGPIPLPGLADVDQPTALFTRLMLPLFVSLGGIMVPSVAAVHTIVVERERRSLELLIALPVRVRDIFAAKLAANLVLAAAMLTPLLLIDEVALIVLELATPAYLAQLVALLLAALACSVGLSLVVALLARDFRTANNLNGVLIGPLILIVLLVLVGVPGDVHLLALAGVLLAIGGVALLGGLRWLTFERYLA